MASSSSNRKILVKRSPIHGNGVFATQLIPANTKIIEYKGTVIDNDEAARLYGDNTDTGHTFLFTLNAHYLVDANRNGNSARWINHSCDPNCHALVYVNVHGDERKDKLWLESLRDIQAGEELNFGYGITLSQRHTARMKAIWACRCGSPKCTGTMLKDRSKA
jgi:uncharacterized protein